jgi:hypothetical protein
VWPTGRRGSVDAAQGGLRSTGPTDLDGGCAARDGNLRSMDPVDLRAQRIGRRQRGLTTRRQLRDEAGVSPDTITSRLAAGRWHERVPPVIDLGTHTSSWRRDVLEVVLAAGEQAWASHATAAHLQRFLDAGLPGRIDVLVPRRRHAMVGGHRLRTTRSIGLDEVTERHGIPCTTPARTLLDLAASTVPGDLERYLADEARRNGKLLGEVAELCDRHRRVPGRRRLLTVLGWLPAGVQHLGSPLEVLGVQELRRLGAPPFEVQYVVRDPHGARLKRVDVAWPDRRTIVEFDGAAYHDLTEARAEDARVRDRMTGLGWEVEVVRRPDLGGHRLADLVRRLRRAVT